VAWADRLIFPQGEAYSRRRLTPAGRFRRIRRVPFLRRAALVLVLAALAAPAVSAAPASLPQTLAQALAVPHLAASESAAVALDLETGQPLFARNGSLPLAPASNEKLTVTYAALSALGAAFTFETDVLGDGSLVGGVWHGDLVLKGYGDPTLSSSRLVALAAQVRSFGIARVTGRVVGDESWFDTRRMAVGWKSSFFLNESPPLSALVVDRARYDGHVSTRPAYAAAWLFRRALAAAGVKVAGGATTGVAEDGAQTIATVRSAPLGTIVRGMDLESDNFTAEELLKELGAVADGTGSSPAGAAVVRRLLDEAGVPLDGVRIIDGSGLSYADRLTANALVALLQVMWADPTMRPILVHSLPVAGISGTLADRLRVPATRGRIVAKTGTTDIASALSGVVAGRVAFAVLQNGHPLAYLWARRAQDRFATALARWSSGVAR
jgi:D-alanyl-D-alanine carboxypeptidase/D-alanyl-D-alanine-endopeptidase (penicillin-binding protein 4)